MLLCFLAGIVYNPLANYGVDDTKNKPIRFERHSYEDSHNRVSAYINMLYTLAYKQEGSICYFDAPRIHSAMPPGIKYQNKKYWKKGALSVLKYYYLPLLENSELIKKYPQIQSSYDLIKVDNLWRHHSAESSYLHSAYYLKDLQKRLISEKKIYIPAGFFGGLKSVKKELSIIAEILTKRIITIDQPEANVLLDLDKIDDYISEAQGSFWAMYFMIMGTTTEVVMYLNDEELMDDLSNVLSQLFIMYKDDHNSLHKEMYYHLNLQNAKNYKHKVIDAMKKQLLDINHLLSLVTKLQCNKVCQMRKRNNIGK